MPALAACLCAIVLLISPAVTLEAAAEYRSVAIADPYMTEAKAQLFRSTQTLIFNERFDLADRFDTVVTMEDGPAKPDPAPVVAALDRLGVARAWMIGDTPDDVRAARAAGVVPLAVVAPGDDPAAMGETLLRAGAARVLADVDELDALLRAVRPGEDGR